MVTRHLLKELGYEVTLVNHVDSQPAQARASERGLRRMKRAHVRARCRGEEADDSCPCQHEVAQSRLEDTVPYIRSAHERMRNAGSETLQRRRKSRLKTFRSDVSSVHTCPDLKGECGETRTFQLQVSRVDRTHVW